MTDNKQKVREALEAWWQIRDQLELHDDYDNLKPLIMKLHPETLIDRDAVVSMLEGMHIVVTDQNSSLAAIEHRDSYNTALDEAIKNMEKM